MKFGEHWYDQELGQRELIKLSANRLDGWWQVNEVAMMRGQIPEFPNLPQSQSHVKGDEPFFTGLVESLWRVNNKLDDVHWVVNARFISFEAPASCKA